jgi:hypothetical protein
VTVGEAHNLFHRQLVIGERAAHRFPDQALRFSGLR